MPQLYPYLVLGLVLLASLATAIPVTLEHCTSARVRIDGDCVIKGSACYSEGNDIYQCNCNQQFDVKNLSGVPYCQLLYQYGTVKIYKKLDFNPSIAYNTSTDIVHNNNLVIELFNPEIVSKIGVICVSIVIVLLAVFGYLAYKYLRNYKEPDYD